MSDCIFCKIVNKEIDAKLVYEDEDIIAFNDINPQAPIHILIIPKKHYSNIDEIDDIELMGKILKGVKEIIKQKDIKSYRLVINKGREAGQSVFHLHVHLLAGRNLGWPPG